MQFLLQKSTKGQAVADFLAERLDSRATRLYEDTPDKIAKVYMTQTSFKEHVWQLFFDGASRMGPTRNIVDIVGIVGI